MTIKIKQVGNHFYPCINHDPGNNISFCRNAERWLNLFANNQYKLINRGEVDIELEEVGVEISGFNMIYFYEEDITRYLTTDDYFDIRFKINGFTYCISSDLYSLLEEQYRFNFHKASYKIHIY